MKLKEKKNWNNETNLVLYVRELPVSFLLCGSAAQDAAKAARSLRGFPS